MLLINRFSTDYITQWLVEVATLSDAFCRSCSRQKCQRFIIAKILQKNQNRVNTHLGIGFHFPFGVSRDRPCDALETNYTARNVAKRLRRTTAAVGRKSVLGTVKRAWRGTLANWSKSYHRRTAKNFLIHLATDEFRMLLLIGFVERWEIN